MKRLYNAREVKKGGVNLVLYHFCLVVLNRHFPRSTLLTQGTQSMLLQSTYTTLWRPCGQTSDAYTSAVIQMIFVNEVRYLWISKQKTMLQIMKECGIQATYIYVLIKCSIHMPNVIFLVEILSSIQVLLNIHGNM